MGSMHWDCGQRGVAADANKKEREEERKLEGGERNLQETQNYSKNIVQTKHIVANKASARGRGPRSRNVKRRARFPDFLFWSN